MSSMYTTSNIPRQSLLIPRLMNPTYIKLTDIYAQIYFAITILVGAYTKLCLRTQILLIVLVFILWHVAKS